MSYIIEPEVAGEIGEKTQIDLSVNPHVITRIHFIFFGWLGDDIIECFPAYLVSERLKIALEQSSLGGFKLKDLDMDVSDEFHLLQPNVVLPKFYWLEVLALSNSDFTFSNNRLKVTDRAFSLLSGFRMNHANIRRLG